MRVRSRDIRITGSVLVVPLLPVLFAFLGNDGLLLAAGPVAAYLMGWAISTDVAYDHTAFWTHLAAPVRGVQDRLGRVVAAAALELGSQLVERRRGRILWLLNAKVSLFAAGIGAALWVCISVEHPVAYTRYTFVFLIYLLLISTSGGAVSSPGACGTFTLKSSGASPRCSSSAWASDRMQRRAQRASAPRSPETASAEVPRRNASAAPPTVPE